MQNPNSIITCPYDSEHVVLASRIQYHIVKCREKNRHLNLVTCPYNAKHINRQEDHMLHLQHCWDRQNVEQDLFYKDDEVILVRPLICGNVQVPEYRESRNADYHWDTEHLPPPVLADERTAEGSFSHSTTETTLFPSVRLPTSEPKLLPRKSRFQILTESDGSSGELESSAHSSATDSSRSSSVERGKLSQANGTGCKQFSRDIYNGSQSSLGSNVSNQSSSGSALNNQSDSSSQSSSRQRSNGNQPLPSPGCSGDASSKFSFDSKVSSVGPTSDSSSKAISFNGEKNNALSSKITEAVVRLPTTEPKVLSDFSHVNADKGSAVLSADVKILETNAAFPSAILKQNVSTAFRSDETDSSDLRTSSAVKRDESSVRLPSTEPKVLTKPKPTLSNAHRSCLPFLSVFKYSNVEREKQAAASSSDIEAHNLVAVPIRGVGRGIALLEQNAVQEIVGVADAEQQTSPYSAIGRGIGRGFFCSASDDTTGTKSKSSPGVGMSKGSGHGMPLSEHYSCEQNGCVGTSMDSHSSDLPYTSFGRGRFVGIGRGLIFNDT